MLVDLDVDLSESCIWSRNGRFLLPQLDFQGLDVSASLVHILDRSRFVSKFCSGTSAEVLCFSDQEHISHKQQLFMFLVQNKISIF